MEHKTLKGEATYYPALSAVQYWGETENSRLHQPYALAHIIPTLGKTWATICFGLGVYLGAPFVIPPNCEPLHTHAFTLQDDVVASAPIAKGRKKTWVQTQPCVCASQPVCVWH